MSKTIVYVVGPEEALKTNQWLAMTNSHEEAYKLLETLDGATTIKEVEVRPSAKSRRR
jgi:hypothetical protein